MIMMTFAEHYDSIIRDFYGHIAFNKIQSPIHTVRSFDIAWERLFVVLSISMLEGISIYSHKNSRVIPIEFVLAEFLWMLSKSSKVSALTPYNKIMQKYSDDGVILNGAYGVRMDNQISTIIDMLKQDVHSRRACISIYRNSDTGANSLDIPCNVFIQFIIRNTTLHMIITSRSSDVITGLTIDIIHWQLLYMLVFNDLRKTYPALYKGSIQYNIASLHLYSYSIPDVKNWIYEPSSEWKINTHKAYTDVVNTDLTAVYVNNTNMLNDACVALGFDITAQYCINTLDAMHKQYWENRRNGNK